MKNEIIKEKENIGRKYFKKFLDKSNKIEKYTFTPPSYTYDVLWKNKDGKWYSGEIKVRYNYSSTSKVIVNDGVLLEKNKYDEMMELYEKYGIIPYYLSFFNDNVLAICDLRTIKDEWYNDTLPIDNFGNNKKKEKKIQKINIKNCKLIKYEK